MDKRLLIIAIILTLIGTAAIVTIMALRRTAEVSNFQPVVLEYWGVYEQPQDIALLTTAYSARHPKVSVRYRTFRPDEYRQKLLEAWAVGQGPDVFMIPSTWIREYEKFMSPMPQTMRVPAQVVQGTIKPEVVDVLQTDSGYTPKNIRDLFLDPVYKDVVIDNQVYGLPLSVDTMVLYYNRQLLQTNNIARPATTWSEIVNHAARISRIDQDENLVQSAIALGGTDNIPNAFDIVSLLMMQVGVQMENTNNVGVNFPAVTQTADALQFYLSFSRPDTIAYSWNDDQSNALDVFTSGKSAYFLGYSYHAPLISQTNPKLDWDVVPVPQADNAALPMTYANYWVTAVAKRSPQNEIAWQFVKEITAANNVKPYLDQTQKTTALLGLVETQQNDITVGPFAELLLQAKNWYHGYDYPQAEDFLTEMVQAVQNGESPETAIRTAGDRINATYKKPTE